MPDDVAVVGIYRRRNAGHVRGLIQSVLNRGWDCAWWALDEVDPDLRDVTVGTGPGLKLPLLNETLQRLRTRAAWTVCSDDDLVFRRGNIVRFVELSECAGLDLSQPARARGTQLSHGITIAPRLSRARLTTFVESGPLFAVGPGCRERLLPLPAARGMGWGVEIDWNELERGGCRLGIVDETTIEHVGELAADYDAGELKQQLFAELATRGNPEWQGMRRTLAVWRPWQRKPPWAVPRGGR